MKKFFTLALASVMVASMSISAAALPADKVTIDVYKNTPVMDGVISEGEWDTENVVVLGKDTALAWSGEVTDDVTYYFCYDEKGLYVGVYAEDNDVNSPQSVSEVYNLDAVQFALDPAGLIGAAGGGGAMFYSVAMMSNGELGALYHPYGGGGIEFTYSGACAESFDGWSFEMMIPWTESIEILAGDGYAWKHADGETINFILAMLDRDESGAVSNCYLTAVESNPQVDFSPANYCYKMVLHDETAPSLVVETEAEVVDTVVDTLAAAPQTFDAGVIAAVAAIVSAAGYAISKKR